MGKKIKITSIISLVLSLIIGGFIITVAMDHNPQGEFCKEIINDECVYDWGSLLFLGSCWSFVSFWFLFIVQMIIVFIYSFIKTKARQN